MACAATSAAMSGSPATPAATSFAALSGLLPITFQGIGTREAIFVIALGREGVSEERAVLLGLMTVALLLFVSALTGAIGYALARRAKRNLSLAAR